VLTSLDLTPAVTVTVTNANYDLYSKNTTLSFSDAGLPVDFTGVRSVRSITVGGWDATRQEGRTWTRGFT
jgi:hypothetical protein